VRARIAECTAVRGDAQPAAAWRACMRGDAIATLPASTGPDFPGSRCEHGEFRTMFTFIALVTGIIVLAALVSPLDLADEARQRTVVSAAIGDGWLRTH
jgi:hypothetical protein